MTFPTNPPKKTLKKNFKASEIQLVLAALGVMSDEFCGPVPVDEIVFCLRVDFNFKSKDSQILSFLSQASSSMGYTSYSSSGWSLTSNGATYVDEFFEKYYSFN